MSQLFNTPDNAEFLGVRADTDYGLEKARKGTPGYEEWLRHYREKRPQVTKPQPQEKKSPKKRYSQDFLRQNPPKKADIETWNKAVDSATMRGEKEVPYMNVMSLYLKKLEKNKATDEPLSYSDLITNIPKNFDNPTWNHAVEEVTGNRMNEASLDEVISYYTALMNERPEI